jgi:hypothetical protein
VCNIGKTPFFHRNASRYQRIHRVGEAATCSVAGFDSSRHQRRWRLSLLTRFAPSLIASFLCLSGRLHLEGRLAPFPYSSPSQAGCYGSQFALSHESVGQLSFQGTFSISFGVILGSSRTSARSVYMAPIACCSSRSCIRVLFLRRFQRKRNASLPLCICGSGRSRNSVYTCRPNLVPRISPPYTAFRRRIVL